MKTGDLVDDYLARLERAARRLAPDQADDLLEDVREHIESALSGPDRSDDAATRQVLDRLGPPEAMVAESAAAGAGTAGDARPAGRWALPARGPWLLGAAAGVVALAAWLPLLSTNGLPAAGIPLLVPIILLAALVLRRPGGPAFFASALGVAGAIAVAVALSIPLTCPDGEFAGTCSGPRLGQIIAPGLALVVAGLLLAGRAQRRA
ncbi:MAG: HAAS signaling domain-containing protein [Candidatus Limnocylindrales bacterium]